MVARANEMNLHPAFRPARLEDLVLWVNPSSVHGTTWQNLAPRYTDVNHGRIIGAQVGELLHPSGVFGSALYFNGQNAYVNCGSDSSLDITSQITIEAWVKTSYDFSSEPGFIVNKYNRNTPTGWALFFQTDNTVWMMNYESLGNYKNAISDSTKNDGNWHHLVGIILSDGTPILYVDGVEQTGSESAGSVTQLNSGSESVKIGVQSNPLERYFNGPIAEVRIYEAALSPAEVFHNYTHSPIYYMQHGIDPYSLLYSREYGRVVA